MFYVQRTLLTTERMPPVRAARGVARTCNYIATGRIGSTWHTHHHPQERARRRRLDAMLAHPQSDREQNR